MRGNHVGRKRAKSDFQMDKMTELSVRNCHAIKDELKKLVRLLEERNVFQAFSIAQCVIAEDNEDRGEFFGLTRAANLK